MLALETIDINCAESLFKISDKLNLKQVLPNKVTIWKLRNNNPMRRSFNRVSISFVEFDALLKLTSEMSKYLYPFIREILQSREDFNNNPYAWNNFRDRYIELMKERLNINTMKVKRLLDSRFNDEIFTTILLSLALSISDEGLKRLRLTLLNS